MDKEGRTHWVKEAAVRQGDKILTGRNHGEIIGRNAQEGGPKVLRDQQGFVTETGAFVNRQEAFQIAKKAGQLLGHAAEKESGNLLSHEFRQHE